MISGSPFIKLLWAVLVLLAGLAWGTDNSSLASPATPIKYSLASGRVTMTLFHPFQVIIARSREFEGEFVWAGERSESPASFSVDAKISGFSSSIARVSARIREDLEVKRFPVARFRTRGVDLRSSSRGAVKRMLLYGELTVKGNIVEVRIPMECAIAPDFSQCKFEKQLSLRELQIPIPKLVGIPSRGWIELSGQFEFVRKGGSGS